MIKLSHSPSPEAITKLKSLEEKRVQCLENGQELPNSVKKGYRHHTVKAAIRQETCDKCAYCESKVTHTYPGDVEHIIPKSVRPDLMLDFYNLTFSCSACNNNKRDYYSEDAPIIDPYKDDPESHMFACGPLIMYRPGDTVGYVTKQKLDLNRMPLVERRKERLESVTRLLDQVVRTRNKSHRQVLIEELYKECDKCMEYSFVVRAYIQMMLKGMGEVGTAEAVPVQ